MDVINSYEPTELAIFEVVGLGVFLLTLFLFLNVYVSVMFMFIVLAVMMAYSKLRKGKTRLWKKVKI